MSDTTNSNKRIAKNTIVLYIRTAFVLCVSLFTSRVILNSLGVEDFGIYNVVGGIVSMFSVISSALSMSISRFITVTLGQNDKDRLRTIFSTSLNIQIILSLIVLVVAELAGYWFLNEKLNIPSDRLYAANWVYQFTIITFIVNLISIPYNALIIAHEKMSAFAYIGIFEVTMKLIVAYAIYITPADKLITYSLLLVIVSVIIRFSYSIYCGKHFEESHYKFVWDKYLMREMSSFAGWNFITNIIWILNTTGINFLINIYFGVTVNAARGIANQVESAVKKFVTDFTTAMNPQIMKNYAIGDIEAMHILVCRSAKFSFFLIMLFSLPIIMETPYLLNLWLGIVPEHTVAFTRLSLLAASLDFLGNSIYVGCQATGRLKKYVVVTSVIASFVFPITWFGYYIGLSVEACYYVFVVLYCTVLVVKVSLAKQLFNLSPRMFISEVILRILPVFLLSVLVPALFIYQFEECFIRFLVVTITTVINVGILVLILGLTKNERRAIKRILIKYQNTKNEEL